MPGLIATIYQLQSLRQSNEKMALVSADGEENSDTVGIAILSQTSGNPLGITYLDIKTFLAVRELKYYYPDMSRAPDSMKQKAVLETKYEKFKSFDGVVLAAKITAMQGGKTLFENTIESVEFPEKFSSDLFEKPQENQ